MKLPLLYCCLAGLCAAAPQLSGYLPPPLPGGAPAGGDCVSEPQLEIKTVFSTELHEVTSSHVVSQTEYERLTRTVAVVSTTTGAFTRTQSVFNTDVVKSTSTRLEHVFSTVTESEQPRTITIRETSTQTSTQTEYNTDFITSTINVPEEVVSTIEATHVVHQKTFLPRVTTSVLTSTYFAPGQIVHVTSNVVLPVTETEYLPAVTRTVSNVRTQTSFATRTVQAPRNTIFVTRTQVVPQTQVVTVTAPAPDPVQVVSTVHSTNIQTFTVTENVAVTNVVRHTQLNTNFVTVTRQNPVTVVETVSATRTISLPAHTTFIPGSELGGSSSPIGSHNVFNPLPVTQEQVRVVTSLVASPVLSEVVVTSTVPGDCGEGYSYEEPKNQFNF